jgi:hypothetical protein
MEWKRQSGRGDCGIPNEWVQRGLRNSTVSSSMRGMMMTKCRESNNERELMKRVTDNAN